MLFRAENSDLAHMGIYMGMGVISGEYSRYAIRDLIDKSLLSPSLSLYKRCTGTNRDMPSQYVGGISGRSEGIVDR